MTVSSPGEKILVKFSWDCGRMGTLSGLFVTNDATLQAMDGLHVELGEVLGKHSDIHGKLAMKDFTVVTRDQAFIEQMVGYLGETISGINPLSYLEERFC